MARIKMERSGGDVFQDIGFGPDEAASLRIRAELMIKLAGILKRRGLTQAAAAKLMGVSQPRVSNLVRGRIDLFSVDMLIDMISRAGGQVRITVRGTRKAA